MIFKNQPADFAPAFEFSGCYLEHAGEFLFLLRDERRSCGGTWGIPGGGVEAGESLLEAMLREVREETQIVLSANSARQLPTFSVRHPHGDFLFNSVHVVLDERPAVQIEKGKHADFQWLALPKALRLPLVQDLEGCMLESFPDLRQS